MSRGIQRERQVKKLLQDLDWTVIRAAGSLGGIDLVALKSAEPSRTAHFMARSQVLFVEVKSSARNAYNDFLPAERAALLQAAIRCNAEPWLCWWPPGRRPGVTWLSPYDWPKSVLTDHLLERLPAMISGPGG